MTTPALVAEGLTRSYEGVAVVDQLELRVEAGEIHALVGLNGAGKTTTMQMFLGMIAPGAGRTLILGEEVPSVPWMKVGHLVDAPLAYGELTVRQNLAASAILHGLTHGDAKDAIAASVERFRLGQWVNRPARVLSHGNRQRLGLAAATIHRPDVLILDEPTNGLDPAGVVLVRDLVRGVAAAGGAILLSSHHLDELARISDDITVLHRGRDIGPLDPDGVDIEREFFAMVYRSEEVPG